MALRDLTPDQLDLLEEALTKVVALKYCMSYNDSYFGEKAGSFKSDIFEVERLMNPRKES